MINIGQKPAGAEGPIQHLAACHRRIEQRLDTLERAAEWIGSESEAKNAEAMRAIRSAIAFLDSSGALHTEDEEQSLFPRLSGTLSLNECEYLEALEKQHGLINEAYTELKSAIAGSSAERYRAAASCVVRLYREHIASEDANLMPLAARSLSRDDLAAISTEMKLRRQNNQNV